MGAPQRREQGRSHISGRRRAWGSWCHSYPRVYFLISLSLMIDVVGTLYLYARNDLLSKPEVHSITNIDDLAGNIYSENSWIREIKQVGILHDPVYWVDCYGGYFDRQVSCWRECIRSIRNDEGPAFSFERPCCHILWRFSLRRHHMFVEMPFNLGKGDG